jgi:hypothetical protein
MAPEMAAIQVRQIAGALVNPVRMRHAGTGFTRFPDTRSANGNTPNVFRMECCKLNLVTFKL